MLNLAGLKNIIIIFFTSMNQMNPLNGVFKVTNPALAQYILVGLLNDHLEDFELGIEIQSIEFGPVGTDKDSFREKLHRAVEEILE